MIECAIIILYIRHEKELQLSLAEKNIKLISVILSFPVEDRNSTYNGLLQKNVTSMKTCLICTYITSP